MAREKAGARKQPPARTTRSAVGGALDAQLASLPAAAREAEPSVPVRALVQESKRVASAARRVGAELVSYVAHRGRRRRSTREPKPE